MLVGKWEGKFLGKMDNVISIACVLLPLNALRRGQWQPVFCVGILFAASDSVLLFQPCFLLWEADLGGLLQEPHWHWTFAWIQPTGALEGDLQRSWEGVQGMISGSPSSRPPQAGCFLPARVLAPHRGACLHAGALSSGMFYWPVIFMILLKSLFLYFCCLLYVWPQTSL